MMKLSVVEHDIFDQTNFMRLAIEHSSDLIFAKDSSHRFIFANHALSELFAPEMREKIIGHTGAEDFSVEETAVFLEEDRKAFANGKSELIEEIVDYRGVRRTFLTRKTRFQGADGQPLLYGVSTDISRLTAREQELVQANAALENFAALAAHDLRSPLSSFIGCIGLVEYDKKNVLSDSSREMFNIMKRSANNLANQVSGLLETFKSTHHNTIIVKNIDLNIIFKEVKFNLGALIERTGAIILSNDLPSLDVDANLFRHMLMNLIENSIKYASDKKSVITIKYVQEHNKNYFAVEDNGIGISRENDEKVFQIYEQVNGQKSSGLGLGLSLCKKIAELHGGHIWIDHDYTAGCRICFTVASEKSAVQAEPVLTMA